VPSPDVRAATPSRRLEEGVRHEPERRSVPVHRRLRVTQVSHRHGEDALIVLRARPHARRIDPWRRRP
jgi:hypothetical protein